MTKKRNKTGWILVVVGLMIAVSSPLIVFPGLERLLGIEAIVGKENVRYQTDGYVYTNPGAQMRWIASVAAGGVLICGAGVVSLWRSSVKRN